MEHMKCLRKTQKPKPLLKTHSKASRYNTAAVEDSFSNSLTVSALPRLNETASYATNHVTQMNLPSDTSSIDKHTSSTTKREFVSTPSVSNKDRGKGN